MLLHTACYYPDASPGFVASLLHGNFQSPDIYDSVEKGGDICTDEYGCVASPVPGSLVAKMIWINKEVRNYRGKHAVSVVTMVLLDGDYNAFKATFDSGLSGRFVEDEYLPGATVVLKRFTVLPMRDTADESTARAIVFVKDFAMMEGPSLADYDVDWDMPSVIEPDFRRMHVDSAVVEKVATGYLIATQALPVNDWLVRTFGDATGKKRGHANEEENEDCDCVKKFGYVTCMKDTYPVERLSVTDLYEQVYKRLHGHVSASSFDGMEPNHKRWCFYWWYAINMFHVRGRAEPLPTCFCNYVKGKYPNKEGKPYVGFKTTDQRQEEALVAMDNKD